jgi:hypothetical protein
MARRLADYDYAAAVLIAVRTAVGWVFHFD